MVGAPSRVGVGTAFELLMIWVAPAGAWACSGRALTTSLLLQEAVLVREFAIGQNKR
jgi:hypothetical protein